MKESEKLLLDLLEKTGEALLATKNPIHHHMVGELVTFLNDKGLLFTPEALGVTGEFFYSIGDRERMEFCLNEADSGFVRENRFAAYRSIYRGLFNYRKAPQHYEQQIHNALFFLKEHNEPLPFLTDDDGTLLEQIKARGRSGMQVLVVRTQGEFSVIASQDGRMLPWRTRKGRELFAYLLEREGEPVERGHLIEILWPEEIPDNAVAMLHNMIYNMRRELSAYCLDKMVVYEKKHYRLNMDNLASDSLMVHEMMRLAKEADFLALRKKEDYFLHYNGRYLKDIDSPWADALGNEADAAFVKGCGILAGEAFAAGNYDRAIRFNENILLVSPYEEEAAAALLAGYGEKRDWNRLQSFYQIFTERLQKDLGLSPGKGIEAAYRKYIRR